MVDKVTSQKDDESQLPENSRRHHRQWWDFNLVLLAIALFPLVYIRHLWNVGYLEIFTCVFIILVTWCAIGCVGQLSVVKTHPGTSQPGLFALLLFAVPTKFVVVGTLFLGGLIIFGSLAAFPFSLLISTAWFVQIVILAVGFVILMKRRSQRKHLSKYAPIGIGGLLFTSLISSLFTYCAFVFPSIMGVAPLMIIIGLWKVVLFPILTFVFWGLVLVALLEDRAS